jgi:hypothetical protein
MRRWPAVSSGGAGRRDPIQGSGPRFGAWVAPTRCARSDEASRDGDRSGEVTGRPVSAATRFVVSGEAPARFLGRHGARARPQTAQGGSIPPCAAPRWLTATRQRRRWGKNGGGGELGLGFWWLAVRARAAAMARVGTSKGRRMDINSPSGPSWHAGHAKGACTARTRQRRRQSPDRRRRGGGDDRWGPRVSDCARGRAGRAASWARWTTMRRTRAGCGREHRAARRLRRLRPAAEQAGLVAG